MADSDLAADFADVDPEDAWDAGDGLAAHLGLIGRIVEGIEAEHATAGATARHLARLAWAEVTVAGLRRHRKLPPGEAERLAALAERLGAVHG